MLTGFIIGSIAGFITGILVGRHNAKKAAALQAVADKVAAAVKSKI